MISELKTISIRGRVAFAATALQNAFIKEKLIEKKEASFLIDNIWEFTSSNALDEWDELIREITPFCLFDPKETFDDFSHFDRDTILELKSFYSQIPKYLVDMIDCTISIGTNNLYGGTGDYSPSSLEPLIEFLELCEENHVEIPPVQDFKIFSFSEAGGWGRIFHKNDVVLSS